ncbi:hypothetical protein [Hyphomicrobium sp. LHD-15]|uniref:hypothetical protein n=1 Tax=Hyphomicrobium sp. LHD-15 TaxID=3072142 RepID=UPI00280CA764|nr:hypothetical protein [Hyphomicrobium sp. LHD-15]MDQ8699122.1 hypothetical protein [Hyphomicrobium sp. LHD-15]
MAAFLAVVLGMLAGAASALGVSTSLPGGPSVSEASTDARSTGKPVSVRLDAYDPSLGFGGGDSSVAFGGDDTFSPALFLTSPIRPHAFGLPIDVARIRNGLSRAPPLA